MGKKIIACLTACTLALSPSFAVPAKGSASKKAAVECSNYNFWPIIATVLCVALGIGALISVSNTQGTHSHTHS